MPSFSKPLAPYRIATGTSQQLTKRFILPNGIDLAEKLGLFEGYWSPKIVAGFNANDVMVAKFKGQFEWHSHADTDDLFYVLKGEIVIRLRDQDVHLSEGQLYVVPKGVEHAPYAEHEAHVMLIEPKNTPNTGDLATAVEKLAI